MVFKDKFRKGGSSFFKKKILKKLDFLNIFTSDFSKNVPNENIKYIAY